MLLSTSRKTWINKKKRFHHLLTLTLSSFIGEGVNKYLILVVTGPYRLNEKNSQIRWGNIEWCMFNFKLNKSYLFGADNNSITFPKCTINQHYINCCSKVLIFIDLQHSTLKQIWQQNHQHTQTKNDPSNKSVALVQFDTIPS